MGSAGSKGDVDPEARKLVEELIKTSEVVIFSRTFCPGSRAAKRIFKATRAKFFTVELCYEQKYKEMYRYLKSTTQRRTSPFIFIGGRNIGSVSRLRRLRREGTLEAMLEYAKALYRDEGYRHSISISES